MNDELKDLEPESVWRHFAAIAAIPRCSGKEQAIRDHVVSLAVEWGLEHLVDTAGNVMIRRQPAPGRESAPTVVLQGHLDMVCEKNRGVTHDFDCQGIRLRRDGQWLRAMDTTLGADNGIAVAMMLALLEGQEATGPLECLFTVDEESGLTGAKELDPTLITGRTMINLDSEEEGFFCIGCAGGLNTYLTLPVVRVTPDAGSVAREILLSGLHGGHSGAEIHLGLGNSLVLTARVLMTLRGVSPELRIAEVDGGGKHNAIPREARVVVVVPAGDAAAVETALAGMADVFRAELLERDPDVALTWEEAVVPELVLGAGSTAALVDLLTTLPNGVLGMSAAVPGLVETSSNLAAVRTGRDGVEILTSQRSSRAELINWAGDKVAAAGRLAGAAVRQGERYPSWTPAMTSPLLDVARQSYQKLFGTEADVGAFHAGLECGVIRDKVGEMDMISFGPDLKSPHTPEEHLSIPSTERTWRLLLDILRSL